MPQRGASGPEVSMRNAAGRPMSGAGRANAWRLAAASGLALAAAACAADGHPTASFVSGRSATVAFESIDGPPKPVFQKLVENLATEAVARQVAVISREATPRYRIRGYMAAHLEGRRIHIGWVWDVYDANRRRVLRIASEEPAGRRVGDAWAAADDAMLRRIASASMDRLAAFLDAPGATRSPGGADGAVVAAAGDVVLETAGAPLQLPATTTVPPRRAQAAASAPGLQAALTLANTRP
jgi:hypothetical protein